MTTLKRAKKIYKSKSGKAKKCAIGFAAAVATSLLSFICSPDGLASPARYHVEGTSIICDHNPVTLRGVNAMHMHGGNDSDLVNWSGIKIVREFVGDLEHAPLQGDAYLDSSHNWTLHPLQQLANNNRDMPRSAAWWCLRMCFRRVRHKAETKYKSSSSQHCFPQGLLEKRC